MLNLQLPAGGEQFDAAVFTQAGEFVQAGHREGCEQRAEEIGGLYCWIVDGRPVIRGDFERVEATHTHTVEIAVDQAEAEQFCQWLNQQGHRASIGRSTGNYVDGQSTSSNEKANSIMNALWWNAYCEA